MRGKKKRKGTGNFKKNGINLISRLRSIELLKIFTRTLALSLSINMLTKRLNSSRPSSVLSKLTVKSIKMFKIKFQTFNQGHTLVISSVKNKALNLLN